MRQPLFGTDGIRGKSGEFPITEKVAFCAGFAFGQQNPDAAVLIGLDTRESSFDLSSAIAEGLKASGSTAAIAGVIPTPVLAFCVNALGYAGGVMITASHNPFTDNGIKFFASTGRKISSHLEKELENAIWDIYNTTEHLILSKHSERDHTLTSICFSTYVNHINAHVPIDEITFRPVLDCANGAGVPLLKFVNERIEVPFSVIHATPDGRNINLNCGAAQPGRMLPDTAALDGDGDRLVLKDSKHRIINGDHLLMFLAEELNLAGVVGTVMTNKAVEIFCQKKDIAFFRSDVGDRWVRQVMDGKDVHLGGETSGHLILDELNGTGDGFAIFLKVLHLLTNRRMELTDLFECYPLMPQRIVNFHVEQRVPFDEIPGFISLISDLELSLNDSGRIFPRYSGTENLLRILIESSSEELNDEIETKLKNLFH